MSAGKAGTPRKMTQQLKPRIQLKSLLEREVEEMDLVMWARRPESELPKKVDITEEEKKSIWSPAMRAAFAGAVVKEVRSWMP